MKKCKKCDTIKTTDKFYKGNGKDGLAYKCKVCEKQYNKDNAERIAEQTKQYKKITLNI